MYETTIFKITSLHPLGQSKPKFHVELTREGGKTVNINGPGHMTKMAALIL